MYNLNHQPTSQATTPSTMELQNKGAPRTDRHRKETAEFQCILLLSQGHRWRSWWQHCQQKRCFQAGASLFRNTLIDTNFQMVGCKLCSKFFSSKSAVRRHTKTFHKVRVLDSEVFLNTFPSFGLNIFHLARIKWMKKTTSWKQSYPPCWIHLFHLTTR